jgi:REP element-mobilizing transposase RayT
VPRGELCEIVHSWKSFTSKEANKLLNRSGDFWQPEYYDHLIRDAADFRHAVHYVLNNPIEAGLRDWKWVGLTEIGERMLHVK